VRVADSPEVLQTEAGFNSALDISSRPTLDPWNLSRIDEVSSGQSATLRSLRIVSGVDSPVVTVLGTVVLTSPEVYLQDSTGGVSVHGESDTSLKIGDEVEVEGKVTPHPFSASFDTPKIRFLWSGDPAPALSVTASQAATGQFDAMFIEVEGRTKSGVLKGQDSSILELEGAHQPFSAILFGTGKDSALGRLRPGSLVRIRGVCVTDPNYTRNLIPFTVLLRTADDVTLLAGPPWWSVGHLFELAWIATGLTFLGVVAYLRAERWRMRAVLEERTRLAREIHDTLAQSLSGIAFQLESSIQRAPADGVDQDHVELALQMARQSRKEAHVTIAALRSLSAEFSIAKILQQMLTAQLHGRNIRAITTTNGSLPRMSAEVETQIFRIAQEAVANILEHANATEITLEICSSDHGLSMTIADNGLGFDTSTAPDVDGGHFGITGMKERARNIGATLNVDSGQGGTTVSLVVPHAHLVNRFTSNFPRFLRSRVFNASIRELRQLLIRQFHASQN
jgi:signal transduction histidine kinase